MKYPTLPEQSLTREMTSVFRGYNHNLIISGGEFYNMQNMSADYYPLMAPRRQRGTFVASGNINGLIAKDELCYVDGTEFVKGTERVEMGLTDTPKNLISMGAYVIIMPDKKYINTSDLTNYGNIEAEYQYNTEEGASVSFFASLCRASGEEYLPEINDVEPTEKSDGYLWLDISKAEDSSVILRQYSEAKGEWIVVSPTYIRLDRENIGSNFNIGDSVTISGLNSVVAHLNGIATIINIPSPHSIVIQGIMSTGFIQLYRSNIKITRNMPVMDFVFESGNRLWGCRYGENAKGDFVNEIYASKLGDFRNWTSYSGISTDSYAASIGTDGAFTGAISYMGYPIFFKENCMHKVYGNNPPYTIQDTACRGVQNGSKNSLAIVNEVLYYKSIYGICAYDGSLPAEISAALGETTYSDAVGGACNNKYYVSMKSGNDYHLFVFDTTKGMWHREDGEQVTQFCALGNEMYYTDGSRNAIKTVFGSGAVETEPINWYVETGNIGFSSPDKKYILNLIVRMSLEFGARVLFYIQYDSCDTWEHIGSVTGVNLRTINVPIRPRRCDHFRLKITGEGYAKIYSICKTLEDGSNL